MSVPAESRPPGAIPTFPFDDLPGTAASGVVGDRRVESAVGEAPDFGGLRLALEAAVRALRSFHEYVGVLERQHAAGVQRVDESQAGGSGWSVAPAAAVSMAEPSVPPREVFPSGQLIPGAAPRAVLTPEQQAHLDAALAQAFGVDLAGEPAPVRQAPASPFAVDLAAAAATRMTVPQPMPAPAALMAAAPPLPDRFSPFAPPEPSGSTLPFSPFQGLEPAPPPPQIDHSVGEPPSESAWPTSPFFGTAQATTAPFRVVEPPPVLVSTVGNPGAPAPQPLPPGPPSALPSVPAAAPTVPAAAVPPPSPLAPPTAPASFPPIPDQGQVFNFAELLRANGQR